MTMPLEKWETNMRHYSPPYALEYHSAWFLPSDWPGRGVCVNLLLPECELQIVLPGPTPDSVLPFVNRPTKNKNHKSCVRAACEMTAELRTCLGINCDTPEQLDLALKRASRLLRGYERVTLERMARPETRRPAVKLQ
jgi:hypothetical protein